MSMRELENAMWESAGHRDAKAFLDLVDEAAVMVCGGYRCSGAEYAQVIKEFDMVRYDIRQFETVAETETLCQVHYVIEITAADPANADLGGTFHVTSTWEKRDAGWKLVFNMDSRSVG